mmetsp:Transcript_9550/g.10688  ORF Transcript_9550/g.10688 Transcript_9550/m.10688 type:complete len:185 (-) Transcript_9550:14-568(-)
METVAAATTTGGVTATPLNKVYKTIYRTTEATSTSAGAGAAADSNKNGGTVIRKTKSTHKGKWHHPLFRRDKMNLCNKMTRDGKDKSSRNKNNSGGRSATSINKKLTTKGGRSKKNSKKYKLGDMNHLTQGIIATSTSSKTNTGPSPSSSHSAAQQQISHQSHEAQLFVAQQQHHHHHQQQQQQ